MTVRDSNKNSISYTYTGGDVTFKIDFDVPSKSYIEVWCGDTQLDQSDFSFSTLNNDSTFYAQITITNTLKLNDLRGNAQSIDITIQRVVPITQEQQFSGQTIIASAIEKGLDKLTLIAQDMDDDIGNLEGRMKTAEGNITDLQGRMSTAEGDIDNLETSMATAEGDITNLQGRMSTAEGHIGTNTNDISGLKTRVTTTEGNIINLQEHMNTAEDDINFLRTQGGYVAGDNIDISLSLLSWKNKSTSCTSICYGDGKIVGVYYQYVVVAEQYFGYRRYWTGNENDNWESIGTSDYPLKLIGYGNGRFVALPAIPKATLSDTYRAVYWEGTSTITNSGTTSIPVQATWCSVCYGDIGRFVAVASDAAIYGDGTSWQSSNITNGSWKSVCYGAGKFVAISDDTIAYGNGSSWSYIDLSSVSNQLKSICYGNGKFVAVGTNVSLSWSGDVNDTWQQINILEGNWISVCYGNGRFVALGASKLVSWSGNNEDGWGIFSESSELSNGENIYCWDNKFFVFWGNHFILYASLEPVISATDTTYTAGDGIAITSGAVSVRAGTGLEINDGVLDCTVTDTTYTAGTNIDISNGVISATDTTYTAGDGIAITSGAVSVRAGTGLEINDGVLDCTVADTTSAISALDSRVTTAEGNITGLQRRMSTAEENIANFEIGSARLADYTDWYLASSLPSSSGKSICYGNGRFVTVSSGTAMYSDDGFNWVAAATPPAAATWSSVCYGNGLFVAISSGDSLIAYSNDGNEWTTADELPIATYWQSVCYGNGRFVAIVSNSSLSEAAYSEDGINWVAAATPPAAATWSSVCYGNGKFVAVAANFSSKVIAYSANGDEWTIVSNVLPANAAWNCICYGNGRFVTIASNRGVYSEDGVNWTTAATPPTAATWSSVCYGNGLFVAVSSSNRSIAYSNDGDTWYSKTTVMPLNTTNWQSVCYGNNRFTAVNSGAVAYTATKTISEILIGLMES